jgi:hypothetical protein
MTDEREMKLYEATVKNDEMGELIQVEQGSVDEWFADQAEYGVKNVSKHVRWTVRLPRDLTSDRWVTYARVNDTGDWDSPVETWTLFALCLR